MNDWYEWSYPCSSQPVPRYVTLANAKTPGKGGSVSKNPDIWRGWAHLAARDPDYSGPPGWLEQEAHPSCSNPRRSWCQLLGMEREIYALQKKERTPAEIMNLTYASLADVTVHLDRNAFRIAQTLAWGDPAGGGPE